MIIALTQYVVTASQNQVKPIFISGLMLKPQAGMNEVRMIQPLRSVASEINVKLELSSNSITLKKLDKDIPRIMIWQRQTLEYPESLKQIKKVLDAGYILISEFDDDPDHFPNIAENKYITFCSACRAGKHKSISKGYINTTLRLWPLRTVLKPTHITLQKMGDFIRNKTTSDILWRVKQGKRLGSMDRTN